MSKLQRDSLVRAFSTIRKQLDRVDTSPAGATMTPGEPPLVSSTKEEKPPEQVQGQQQQKMDVAGDYQFTVVLRPNIVINMPEQKPPVINVTLPAQKPPVVNVTAPRQAPPVVNVTAPQQSPPQITVNVPEQKALTPQIVVNVPEQKPPVVNVEIPPTPEPSKLRVIRGADGKITGVEEV
jgi:hypothetical protein